MLYKLGKNDEFGETFFLFRGRFIYMFFTATVISHSIEDFLSLLQDGPGLTI